MSRRIYSILLICLLIFLIGTMVAGCNSKNKDNWINVSINTEEAKELQKQVDNGHRPGLLDPEQVAREFLSQQLKINGKVSSIQSDKKNIDKGEVNCTVIYEDGTKVKLVLTQPVKKDRTGIWMVKKYLIQHKSN